MKRIHQFSFATSSGSGVTNGQFYTQKILRELGFISEIYSTSIAEDLTGLILPAAELQPDPEALLFVHHFLGYDNTEWLFDLPNPKVMVYHNITPPELLPADSEIGRYAVLGREQLAAWHSEFVGAIGDSQLNTNELIRNKYLNTVTIPMLVDLDKYADRRLPPVVINQWHFLRGSYNLLFVGRICENKNQVELVEVMAHLVTASKQSVRLILAGETTSGLYADYLSKEINRWGLRDQIFVTGKLSEEALLTLYRNADAFVCLSKHEGFGMPLIEAMQHGLPVIARDSSSIADTLGGAGYLLPLQTSAQEVAASILTLMTEPAWKRSLLRRQAQRLKQFSKRQIKSRLVDFLRTLSIATPVQAEIDSNEISETWQIEGPFDSSYSLAIVNREIARAISTEGVQTSLRSHEGAGDFDANPIFLSKEIDCARLVEHGFEKVGVHRYPMVALRYCYPPYLNNMPAEMRVVHCYGWEETGYPQEFVDEFNRRLDLVCVHSELVGKQLRDNGVQVPIVIIGGGADHVLREQSVTLSESIVQNLRGFRFLHISSCFPRKGIDALLKAYGQSFSIDDDVSLIIKTFPNPHNRTEEMLKQLRAETPQFPHVVLINEDWPQAELVALYKLANAFVAPSRGEGFGIPMAEAMFMGLPVVTTSWGGQREFCRPENSWLCDFKFAKTETHLGLTHSLWAEPDIDDLALKLKEVFEATDDELQRKTRKARELVERDFTWAITAQKIIASVRAMRIDAKLRKRPKIGWISTWNARCGIANYSHFLTQQIPSSRLRVLANHIPERMAIDQDYVLRCWNAEQAETFEYALETMLEEGIEAVVIQYNFGFCSTQNLAAFLQQLKAHHIQAHVFFHSTADVKHLDDFKSLSTIRAALAQAERLYVHGVEDVNRLKEWGLVDNVVYFPHGIAPMLERQSNKPLRWQDKTVIASYGFLLPHKGIRELIEAFALLRYGNDDYHLLLVNALYPASVSTETERICRQRIEELGLQEHVTLITEYLSDQETKQHLSNADLIVYAYQGTQESSSAAVRVGLSVGSPVLVTPLAIFSDVAEAVHYLPGTSAEMIAAGIWQFMKQEAQTEEKKSRIERWFAERSWPMLSRRLVNIIDGLANPLEGGGRNC